MQQTSTCLAAELWAVKYDLARVTLQLLLKTGKLFTRLLNLWSMTLLKKMIVDKVVKIFLDFEEQIV
jgi:hypothetical protein